MSTLDSFIPTHSHLKSFHPYVVGSSVSIKGVKTFPNEKGFMVRTTCHGDVYIRHDMTKCLNYFRMSKSVDYCKVICPHKDCNNHIIDIRFCNNSLCNFILFSYVDPYGIKQHTCKRCRDHNNGHFKCQL